MKLSSSTPARVLASTRAGVHEQSPKPMSPSRYPPSAATDWNWTLADDLAHRFGDSFYNFDEGQLRHNCDEALRAFRTVYPRTQVAYSYKANHLPAVCRTVTDAGLFADVASELDLWLARRLGVPGERTVYTGTTRSADSLTAALATGCRVNLDSLREVRLLLEARDRLPPGVHPIGLRCALSYEEVPVQRLGMDPTGEEFAAAVEAIRASTTLRLAGLHGHTPGPSVAAFAARASQLIAIANRWIPDDLDYLDVGGGFYGGVPAWSPEVDGPPPRFADYAEAIHEPLLAAFGRGTDGPLVIVEPGTSLVANAFTYVTRVLAVKRVGRRRVVMVDGSLLDTSPNSRRVDFPVSMLRSVGNSLDEAGRTGGSGRTGEAVRTCRGAVPTGDADPRHESLAAEGFDVAGSTLIEAEYMALDVAGPVSEGDFLVFANVGAYSISMGTEFLRPRVAVVQNREGDWRAVRQAGTPREVFPEIG